jgi:hypothetical protein
LRDGRARRGSADSGSSGSSSLLSSLESSTIILDVPVLHPTDAAPFDFDERCPWEYQGAFILIIFPSPNLNNTHRSCGIKLQPTTCTEKQAPSPGAVGPRALHSVPAWPRPPPKTRVARLPGPSPTRRLGRGVGRRRIRVRVRL